MMAESTLLRLLVTATPPHKSISWVCSFNHVYQ